MLNEAGSNNWNRADMLKRWHTYGGVLIIGYTMYRNLAQCLRVKSKHQKKIFKESLVDPGKPFSDTCSDTVSKIP